MNQLIKTILENNGFDTSEFGDQFKHMLNSAIIEICEEQKNECASDFDEDSIYESRMLTSKNIAE